jgi:hypothetical protein
MNLRELAKKEPSVRNLMSWMLLTDKEYLRDIERGLPFFTADELQKIEKSEEYRQGLTFEDINGMLSEKGMILKLATFKKYINLKLIPTSTGRKARGKGSAGLYPPGVIRTINFIKYVLYANIDSFETVVGRFETTALEVIENSFELGDLSIADFLAETENKFGEDPPTAIKRCVHELNEQEVITKEYMEEVTKTADAVDALIRKAESSCNNLLNLLGEIPVTGPLGLAMVLKGSVETK